jgi:hypothetical protein
VITEGAAQTHGLELFAKYSSVRRWTESAGITELRGTSPPGTGYPAVADHPRHEVNVQSKLDVTRLMNFDASFYYGDAISHLLPPLNRADIGVSTRPVRGFTFFVWGRNLQQGIRKPSRSPLLAEISADRWFSK